MKKLLLILPVLLLTGCLGTVPIQRNFPNVPEDLKVACPDLNTVEPTTKFSDVVSVVTKNYGQYQECQLKVDAWIEWYKTQKQIFESVN
jgi:hypothetical protein